MIFTILPAACCWAPPMPRPFLTHSVWILPTTLSGMYPIDPQPQRHRLVLQILSHMACILWSYNLKLVLSDSWVQLGGIINLPTRNMLFTLLDREKEETRGPRRLGRIIEMAQTARNQGFLELSDPWRVRFQIVTPRKEFLQIQMILWPSCVFVSFVSGVSNHRWSQLYGAPHEDGTCACIMIPF